MDFKQKPLVSIVTPFYNTEEYLEECIMSVINQKYQNYEYILVDNCSTDGSSVIVKKYLNKDSRIKYIQNTTFLSQVGNYNHSLRQISNDSKYCKVVQADDWIFPDCVDEMVALAERDPSIGVVAGYRLQGRMITNDGLEYATKTIPGKVVCRENLLLDGSQIFGSPTTVMFRSDIVRNKNPFYSESDYFEDSDVCFDILKKWNFGFVFKLLVYERNNNESISSGIDVLDPSWMLAKYIRLSKYGEFFLDSDEYGKRMKIVQDAYFRFLAQNYFYGRSSKFWDYHKNGLRTIGCELNKSTFGRYVFMEILDHILNPKAAIGRVYRAFRKRL